MKKERTFPNALCRSPTTGPCKCMKRKCAQLDAPSLTCCLHGRNSGSISTEQRVALMLHFMRSRGGRWEEGGFQSFLKRKGFRFSIASSRPMGRAANRPTEEIISKVRPFRLRKFKTQSFGPCLTAHLRTSRISAMSFWQFWIKDAH